MVCHNTVTTSTGKFRLYQESLTRCEAKKKCKSLGQILAPITREYDLNAIKNLQIINERSPSCDFGSYYGAEYHVGVDVKNIAGTLVKQFTDGQAWDECVHDDLYNENVARRRMPTCPIAVYGTHRPYSLSIDQETPDCTQVKIGFICLEPAKPKEQSKIAEALHMQQSTDLSFIIVAGIGGAVLMLVVFAAVNWRKMKKFEMEMKAMKEIIDSAKI